MNEVITIDFVLTIGVDDLAPCPDDARGQIVCCITRSEDGWIDVDETHFVVTAQNGERVGRTVGLRDVITDAIRRYLARVTRSQEQRHENSKDGHHQPCA